MITDFRHTAEKLQRRIDEIAAYVYRERAPISGWRVGPGELPGAHDSSFDDSGWAEFRPLEAYRRAGVAQGARDGPREL